ncbi:protein involved in cell wall biosynthesis, morphogenesis and cell division [Candidatus Protochlamydia naegleriophila]|uniref:Protein involved in cell wall biosynthesis, morphogenesis and cell division n=1 Tax=Candidatus Protochlamydia naegleriophila TaxID=389348 RepID=A0A0U5JJA3_9BACT|nr:HAD-IB family hydrolase [Candidatus Protochlamydia naegleriophila]CUI17878.1 protein involved in cell wall biosynthesis, morphogenesis and cell division [Candidatus Protochlamydia naegleriophila]
MTSIVAAFDFDNTLTVRDSLVPFLFEQAGFLKASYYLAALIPDFLQFQCGYLSRQATKEKILTKFFKGVSFCDLQMSAKRYAANQLDSYLNPQAVERLKWHQQQGHRCILVSASIDLYLCPWAERHGFEKTLASTLALDKQERVTGLLKGNNCWGAEKVKRIEDYLGPRESYQLYAYGDSRGDQELLALADYPFYRSF